MRVSSLRRMGEVKRNPSKFVYDTIHQTMTRYRRDCSSVRCGNNQMMGYATLTNPTKSTKSHRGIFLFT